VAFCIAQVSQKGALQGDNDILHLLASDSVALFISLAEVSSTGIPVRKNISVAADQRPLKVRGRGLVGMTTIMPLFLDGAEELTSIMVGGDDCPYPLDGVTKRGTIWRNPECVPAATQATTAITSAPDMANSVFRRTGMYTE
jgi:hypothetical protein